MSRNPERFPLTEKSVMRAHYQDEYAEVLNHTIPLGGIGAGFLLVDERGRLYNHIQESDPSKTLLLNTFPCIRIQGRGVPPYVRVLRGGADSDAPAANSARPPELKQGHCQHEFHYPRALFRSCDPEAPLPISWSYLNPVIPYDPVASAMPVMVMEIRVENTGPDPVDVDVLFVVDNIVLQDAGASHPIPGLVHAVRIAPVEDGNGNFKKNVFRGTTESLPPEMVGQYEFNGLVFGDRRKSDEGEPGFNACLAVKERQGARISISEYNPALQKEFKKFWRSFTDSGKVPVPGIPSAMHAGVIAVSGQVPAGTAQQFVYAFAWHMPEGPGEKKGRGGGYSHRFKSAQDTANHALKHLIYLTGAVEKWQRKLLTPPLPANYGAAVIHGSRAFTTHTRYTPNDGLMLCHGDVESEKPSCSWDFLTGRAFLIFAPHFHTQAVTTCLAQTLAMLDEKTYPGTPEALCATASLFLSAYADALFLGHRARMSQWLRSMYTIVDALFNRSLSGYAVSGVLSSWLTHRGMGLWSGALTVLAAMAREAGETGAAEKYQKLAGIVGVRYDTELLGALSILDNVKSAGDQTGAQALSCEDLLVLEGPCCMSLLGIEPASALKKILTILTARLENAPAHEYCRQDGIHACVLGALVCLLYKKGGGLVREEAETLLKNLLDRYGASMPKAAAGGLFPPVETLSLWAVLQALTGFYYDGLHQTLYLRPIVIPKESMCLPLFTPLSLGSIIIKRDDGEERSVMIRFSTETPLTIRSVIVLLPMVMRDVQAACISDSEVIVVQQEISGDEYSTRLLLTFKSPLKMVDSCLLRLVESRQAGNSGK